MSAKEFNQLEYIKEYNKAHYKDFKAKLKIEDYEKVEEIRKKHNLNKSEFIIKCSELLKKQKN